MVTKELMVPGRAKRSAKKQVLRMQSCRCGQALDVCVRSHCPRCGSILRRD